MKCKIYLSDEGFGPMIRQSSIIEELRLLEPGLRVEIQTEEHFKHLPLMGTPHVGIKRSNNIRWMKNRDGSPDIAGTKKYMKDYPRRAASFIAHEIRHTEADFVIADFVPEVFAFARQKGIPAFGVCHFTWDWFFSKIYPSPLSRQSLRLMVQAAQQADILFFPPFTPREILGRYKNIQQVPLVVRKAQAPVRPDLDHSKFNVLMVDSGSEVLGEQMRRALRQADQLSGFHFYAPAALGARGRNVTPILKKELLINYMNCVDLVIARAGFNTISECIAFRTPMLLLGEDVNPEISENMMHIKKENLGSFVSLEKIAGHFGKVLARFIEHELPGIRKHLQEHALATDGAKVIAREIISRVERKRGWPATRSSARGRLPARRGSA